MNNEITFISNNVKGILNSFKRIKLLEYLKSYVTPNGFILLLETHSCINDEIRCKGELDGVVPRKNKLMRRCYMLLWIQSNRPNKENIR